MLTALLSLKSGIYGNRIFISVKQQLLRTVSFFNYKDSVPKAGDKAIYSDKFVAFTNGKYPERVEVKLNKLIKVKH
jgi:hypothetical protein